MSGWTRFIRTTVVGGLVFLIPFVILVLVLVLGKALEIMRVIAQPLSAFIPVDTVGGIALANLLEVGLILVLCFVAGLVAKARLSAKLVEGLEGRFLERLPVYHFIKGMAGSIVQAEGDESMKTVLARFDDNAQIAFEIERTADGQVVVYLPGAPNPWSGSVALMAAERVTPLDVPMMTTVQKIKQLGKGSQGLLRG
ncbi:DUF502 domain-containing protein [Pelagibius marinus]|uniref:DUF502 domain-containing protein n=1 Tax=Pelagibius marinus TaxID=2762760 RepID=UPI001872D7B3|nr:DUF502 domain-containing protein [Pelagibius marinus]